MSSSGYAGAVLVLFGVVAPLVAEPDTSSSRGSDYTQGTSDEYGGKKLDDWIHQLRHIDPSKREEAIKAIVMFGPKARPAVRKLVERLHDADAGPRATTVFALRMLQPYIDDKDVSFVVDRLADRVSRAHEREAIVRFEAVLTLAKFGDKAHRAMGALIKGVTDSSTYQMRLRCVQLLRHLGRNPKDGADPDAVRALLLVLNGDRLNGIRAEPTFAVKLEAIMGLGALGRPKAPPARVQGVIGGGTPGAKSGSGVSPLLRLEINTLLAYTKGTDTVLAIWAYVSLLALEDNATKQRLEVLVKYTKDKKNLKPHAAARWLEIRMNAIRALGAVGEGARPMTDKLLALTNDKNVGVVIAVYFALDRIWGEARVKDSMNAKAREAFDAIVPFLKSDKNPERIQAAAFFGSLGPKGKPALPALINTLKDNDPFVLMACIGALAQIGDSSDTTLNALITMLDRKESEILRMTCMAFMQLDKPAPDVLKALTVLSLRKDVQPDVKDIVKETIKKLSEPKKPAKVAKD